MVIEALKEQYNRDLVKLKKEIQLYHDEKAIWKVENSIKNSGGNLCLHIIGNLRAYVGYGLAKVTYVRQQEDEFSTEFVSRKELCTMIDETIEVVNQGLEVISDEQLNEQFPLIVWKQETGMAFTIIHLHSHLNYHLGQINYHRRLLDEHK